MISCNTHFASRLGIPVSPEKETQSTHHFQMRTCTGTSTSAVPRIFSIQAISLHCPPRKTGFFFFFYKILCVICIRQSLAVLFYFQEKGRVRLIVKITFSQTPTVRQVHHHGFWIDELLYFSFSAKATWVSSAGKRIE